MVHDINNSTHGGALTISTRRTGAGFDTNAPINETSVGLRNTKRRLALMSHGTIAIDSQIDLGTTVVTTIPIQQTDSEHSISCA